METHFLPLQLVLHYLHPKVSIQDFPNALLASKTIKMKTKSKLNNKPSTNNVDSLYNTFTKHDNNSNQNQTEEQVK